jgi:hypothetical protein
MAKKIIADSMVDEIPVSLYFDAAQESDPWVGFRDNGSVFILMYNGSNYAFHEIVDTTDKTSSKYESVSPVSALEAAVRYGNDVYAAESLSDLLTEIE